MLFGQCLNCYVICALVLWGGGNLECDFITILQVWCDWQIDYLRFKDKILYFVCMYIYGNIEVYSSYPLDC